MEIIECKNSLTYDVIGDIHGHYEELEKLLETLGYAYDAKTLSYAAKDRKAVFMGDYIDRGSQNLNVVMLVKNMVECGHAYALMGNHEFNAIEWATPSPAQDGIFQRPHSEKNNRQHKKFLDEVEGNAPLHASVIDWFKTLPLCLTVGDNHFVHACWYPSAIEYLTENDFMSDQGALTKEGWHALLDHDSDAYDYVDVLLKGPEENLPAQYRFDDGEGYSRKTARVTWWLPDPTNFADAYTNTSLPLTGKFNEISYEPREGSLAQTIRAELKTLKPNEKIFVGHYWMRGEPEPLSPQVCCVDYSVAKGGSLISYQLTSDQEQFAPDHFTVVQKIPTP